MTLLNYLQFILFILCIIGSLCVLIFILRRKNDEYDYDKIIMELNQQKEDDLKLLDQRNKEIDKIEQQILKCKKELGLRVFKN